MLHVLDHAGPGHRTTALAIGIALAVLTHHGVSAAQNHNWKWPLYTAVRSADGTTITGQPRPAIWGGTAELQELGNLRYLHPGSDIRGTEGDIVVVPTDSRVLRTWRYENDCVLAEAASCRIWFEPKGDPRYLHYVSHVSIKPRPDIGSNITTEVREAFENANAGSGPTDVLRGQRLTVIANFDEDWDHLHIGIVDRAQSYALLHAPDFLEQDPVGQNGESLHIVDDEPPTLQSVELVRDGQSRTTGQAIALGQCGPEVGGDLDIIADAHDTFFTDGAFNAFSRNDLNPVAGIRAASAEIRRLPSGELVSRFDWADLAPTPLTCGAGFEGQACLLQADPTPDIRGFFDRMNNEAGAPSHGTTLLTKLFDLEASTSDFRNLGEERYFHILTNTGGNEGAWRTAALADGRYQVTASVIDFANLRKSRSLAVTVHQPGGPLDLGLPSLGDAFVRDHALDVGLMPSNENGEAWWESPDIFIVPQGATVDVGTADLPSNQVSANTDYDVYVRVQNAGCNAVTGVGAMVLSANPSALNSTWRPITPPGQFVGSVTIPPMGRALVGPFPWRPTPEEVGSTGHRCVIAAVSSAADPLPAGRELDAVGHNNVAQRNVQARDCAFQLPNATIGVAAVDLRLETDAPLGQPGVVVELSVTTNIRFRELWTGLPGTTYREQDGRSFLQVHRPTVQLPRIFMAPGETFDFRFRIAHPTIVRRSFVRLFPTVNGSAGAGYSCTENVVPPPPGPK